MSDLLRATIALLGSFALAAMIRLIRRTLAWREYFGSVERYELWDAGNPYSADPQNPTGRVLIDRNMLARVDPQIARDDRAFLGLQHSLQRGDGQPAVVVNVNPIVIAAYNDELDVTNFLSFAYTTIDNRTLKVGQKLACSTIYHHVADTWRRIQLVKDLHPGPADSGNFDNLRPRIVDFICADPSVSQRILQGVPETSWARLREDARRYLAGDEVLLRDGRLSRCHIPARGNLWWSIRQALRTFL